MSVKLGSPLSKGLVILSAAKNPRILPLPGLSFRRKHFGLSF
jgi:hypothetical protein